jgi:23S rRNA (guanosine2251-2'-O)-methyltransferase
LKKNNNEMLCWGKNAVEMLLESEPERCSKIIINKKLNDRDLARLSKLAESRRVAVEFANRSDLDRLCEGENHQGILALVLPPVEVSLEELISDIAGKKDKSLLIMLDHIKDPHNLGAVTRTAEVFGADGIIIPKNRSVSLTGTVIKVSSGAALRIPIVTVTNLSRSIDKLKKAGYWITGLDHEAEVLLWEGMSNKKNVLVAGSEGEGLSRLVKSNCDELRKIPMAGNTGSLNVSVACAIGIYEWYRSVNCDPGYL